MGNPKTNFYWAARGPGSRSCGMRRSRMTWGGGMGRSVGRSRGVGRGRCMGWSCAGPRR